MHVEARRNLLEVFLSFYHGTGVWPQIVRLAWQPPYRLSCLLSWMGLKELNLGQMFDTVRRWRASSVFCRVDQSFDFLWLSMLRTFFAYYMTWSGRSLLRVILEIVWNFIWIANQSSFNNLSVLTLIWFNEILFTSALYLRHLPSQPSFSSLPYPTPSQIHNFFLLLVVHTHVCDMYTYTYMWVYIYSYMGAVSSNSKLDWHHVFPCSI